MNKIGEHIIREKALDFEKKFNITDFKASEGRIDQWKNIHNVAFATVSGEGSSRTEETTASWEQAHLTTVLTPVYS